PSHDTSTFGPAAASVADLGSIGAGEPPDVVRRRLRELVAMCGIEAEAERTVQRLGLLFGLTERPEESMFAHSVQAGFLALVDGLARDHAVVLVFEDAHTFQAPMLDLVERLGTPSRSGPRRALVVALARGELLEQRPGWGSGSGN